MFADPEHNIAHLSWRPGMRVADFGAGSGAYTIAIAKKIAADNGVVYALEVQADILERLKNEANRLGLTNIETIWADIEKPGGAHLADHSIDAAVVSNILFQAENKNALVAEVGRVLKPGGQVLLVDWADSFGGLGPIGSAVVPETAARQLFTAAGFNVRENFVAGAHHYGLLLLKS